MTPVDPQNRPLKKMLRRTNMDGAVVEVKEVKTENGSSVTAEATEVDNNEALNRLNAAFLGSSNGISKTDVECADFNFQLIQEVKKRPCLYNMNDDTYNNNAMRATMWIEIANKFNTSSEFVKTRWKTMRDRYKKEEKRWRQGKHTSWNFFPQLHFISPYLRARYPHDPEERAVECLPDEDAGSPNSQPTLADIVRDDPASTSPEPPTKKLKMKAELPVAPQPVQPVPQPVVQSCIVERNERATVLAAAVPPVAPVPLSINTASSPTGAAGQSTPVSLGSNQQTTMSHSNWRMDEEEDEMFGHLIAKRLSKMSPQMKEQAKIQMLSMLYNLQFPAVADH